MGGKSWYGIPHIERMQSVYIGEYVTVTGILVMAFYSDNCYSYSALTFVLLSFIFLTMLNRTRRNNSITSQQVSAEIPIHSPSWPPISAIRFTLWKIKLWRSSSQLLDLKPSRQCCNQSTRGRVTSRVESFTFVIESSQCPGSSQVGSSYTTQPSLSLWLIVNPWQIDCYSQFKTTVWIWVRIRVKITVSFRIRVRVRFRIWVRIRFTIWFRFRISLSPKPNPNPNPSH